MMLLVGNGFRGVFNVFEFVKFNFFFVIKIVVNFKFGIVVKEEFEI